MSKGATFELVDLVDAVPKSVLVLNIQSALYQFLSELPRSITLDEDLACREEECTAGTVSRVMVGGAVYKYNPPPCVYLHYDVDFMGDQGVVNTIGEPGTLCADGTSISSYEDCLEALKSLRA